MLRSGLSRWSSPDAALERLAERTPMHRVASGSEIGRAILFLADSDQSSFITGQALVADGGALARAEHRVTPAKQFIRRSVEAGLERSGPTMRWAWPVMSGSGSLSSIRGRATGCRATAVDPSPTWPSSAIATAGSGA